MILKPLLKSTVLMPIKTFNFKNFELLIKKKILCSQFLTNWLENTDKILLAPIREAFQQSESNILQLNQIKDLDRNIKLVEQRFEKLWKDISKFFNTSQKAKYFEEECKLMMNELSHFVTPIYYFGVIDII